MKINIHKTVVHLFVLAFLAATLLPSCQHIGKDQGNGKASTDFDGAMLYEFNMTKDPVTGKIPEGTYEAELAQAKDLYKKQVQDGIVTLSSYIFQGPDNLGGRTRALAYDVRYNGTSNQVIIAGGVSGGVYKSTDNGATWVRKSPTGEHFSCTSLAQDKRAGFEDTWYYTVGEASGNSAGASGAGYSGNGVYKSTDNGETWARLTASNTTPLNTFTVAEDYINRIIVDPTDGYIYIACAATIRRSMDGGASWGTVLSGTLTTSTQHTDVAVTSTGRLYASFGGTNSSTVDGVWASPPGPTSGDPASWVRIAGAGAGGSPTGWNAEPGYGRVVLGIAPSAENLVYALYYSTASPLCPPFGPGGAVEAELFRWDDIGGTWTDLSATLPDEPGCLGGNDPFAVQGGYDLVVAVKPDASSTVFIGGTNAYRSTDAGLTWTRIGGYASPTDYSIYTGSHPDIHSFVFQPTSSTTMLCSNDGGIQRTTDNLASTVAWTPINSGYRTYQYYYVTLDPTIGNAKVLGGAQDNGSTRNTGGTGSSFEMVYGGDGVSVGLSSSGYEYVGSQNGYINRRPAADPLGFTTDITPTYANTVTSAGLFVTLFRLDPDNTELLYYVNDDTLYRTTSASTVASGTWTKMTGVAAAVGTANDITALATTRGTYSPSTASLFMGTSNGKIFRLDDPASVAAGTGPVDITGGITPAGYISSIAVNPRNDDTVIVTMSSYGATIINVWWTGNANSATPTWTNVEGSISLFSCRSSAIAVTSAGVEYFVGTAVGLYNAIGLPGTVSWAQDGASETGNVVVSSIALRTSDNKLLIGTHGYGMWYAFLSLPIVPVTLTEFTGTLQGKNVLLQWKTSAEYNTKHFELERSFNGTGFTKIATLPAAGNSNTSRQYSYTDRGPLTEKNYYRLRTIDLDGTNKLSNTILIKQPGIEQDILIMGNPFKRDILIRFRKEPVSGGELRLVDMAGRLIAVERFSSGQQQVQFILPVGAMVKGIYNLQAFIDGKKFSRQVLKE